MRKLAIAAICCAISAAASVPTVLKLDASKTGAPVQPTMYGLFFEDINYAADGGIYAEKIKNRSFEFPNALTGWIPFGKVSVAESGGPFERNPRYVTLTQEPHNSKHTGLQNEGFFGVSFKKGEEYRFSVYGRHGQSGPATIRVELVDPASKGESMVVASAKINVDKAGWSKYTANLVPGKSVSKGVLRVFLEKNPSGSVDLDHVSLFPVDTWNGHENGLRKDIATALADIKPGLLRFPGGCIVEGTEIPDRYQWKNTVGPVENRPLNINRWQFEFQHRFSPDYYQSYGLGFYEYFLFAEEIGAEPLPVLNVGMVCQYENPDPKVQVPVDSLDEYIQDAIDLIEFANGDTNTTWGGLRASMGHPEPFNLKFLAIGNEQWGSEYVERLEPFVKALRKAHPEIKIVGSSGPSADGKHFDYLWPEMRRLGADLVDEHYYQSAEWFRDNAARYDNYDRRGPKVFAGEYACHPSGRKFNHFDASLLEAAFMTGLERNADIVQMATYAPLLAHEEGWQWRPDMVWFNGDTVNLTASYFVQRMYARNKGTNVASLLADGKPLTGQDGLYASAVFDADTDAYIVKIVNINKEAAPFEIILDKLPKKAVLGSVECVAMGPTSDPDSNYYSADMLGESVIAAPAVEKRRARLSLTVAPRTFALYRIPVQK